MGLKNTVDRNHPPAQITFRYLRTGIVQSGEWFIAPQAGTLYLWNFKEPSEKPHPVYELIITEP